MSLLPDADGTLAHINPSSKLEGLCVGDSRCVEAAQGPPKEMKANCDPEAKGKLGKGVMSSEQQWRKTVLAADFEEKKKKRERGKRNREKEVCSAGRMTLGWEGSFLSQLDVCSIWSPLITRRLQKPELSQAAGLQYVRIPRPNSAGRRAHPKAETKHRWKTNVSLTLRPFPLAFPIWKSIQASCVFGIYQFCVEMLKVFF